jgi:hypothetical protein
VYCIEQVQKQLMRVVLSRSLKLWSESLQLQFQVPRSDFLAEPTPTLLNQPSKRPHNLPVRPKFVIHIDIRHPPPLEKELHERHCVHEALHRRIEKTRIPQISQTTASRASRLSEPRVENRWTCNRHKRLPSDHNPPFPFGIFRIQNNLLPFNQANLIHALLFVENPIRLVAVEINQSTLQIRRQPKRRNYLSLKGRNPLKTMRPNRFLIAPIANSILTPPYNRLYTSMLIRHAFNRNLWTTSIPFP